MKLFTASALKGTIQIPADKSISHRSIIFGSINCKWKRSHECPQGEAGRSRR